MHELTLLLARPQQPLQCGILLKLGKGAVVFNRVRHMYLATWWPPYWSSLIGIPDWIPSFEAEAIWWSWQSDDHGNRSELQLILAIGYTARNYRSHMFGVAWPDCCTVFKRFINRVFNNPVLSTNPHKNVMPNGNKCQISCANWFNNPVDSVIRTISSPLEMCAVGGLVRRGARSPHFLFVFHRLYRPDRCEHFHIYIVKFFFS